MAKESVVIVGTGWAGYTVSERLDDKKFDITIISPQDTLPYTPLLVCNNIRYEINCTNCCVGKRRVRSFRFLISGGTCQTQEQTTGVLPGSRGEHRF